MGRGCRRFYGRNLGRFLRCFYVGSRVLACNIGWVFYWKVNVRVVRTSRCRCLRFLSIGVLAGVLWSSWWFFRVSCILWHCRRLPEVLGRRAFDRCTWQWRCCRRIRKLTLFMRFNGSTGLWFRRRRLVSWRIQWRFRVCLRWFGRRINRWLCWLCGVGFVRCF